MKKLFKFMLKTVIYLILAIVILVAILWIMKWIEDYNRPKGVNVVGAVNVVVDEKEEAFVERMSKVIEIYKHPAGITRHSIDFNYKNEEDSKKSHIVLQIGKSKVTFDFPIDITIFPDLSKMSHISLSMGLDEKSTISHEDAKKKMYEILESITDAGWKRYIHRSAARICGREALLVQKDLGVLMKPDLDESYMMPFDDWFSVGTYHWQFYYGNEAIMRVDLHREGQNDLSVPVGYFLSIDVKSIENYGRDGYEYKDNWQELLVEHLPKSQKSRQEEEQKAINLGYHICKDYVDPPMNKGIFKNTLGEAAVVPVNKEIIIRSGALCPKSGIWQAFLPKGHPKEKLIAQSNAHTIHCAKDTHILKFGLSSEDEADVRWKWISESQEQYDPNQ